MDEGDYYCRARDCEIYKEANLAEIQDLREDEIFWPCDRVPIPKIDFVDFVFTHISECIELDQLPEADEKFLIDVEDKINEYTQSKYSHMKENRNKVFKVVTVSGKKELVRIESRITV
jgi:hypothetical protein